jgi:hypothetical protein
MAMVLHIHKTNEKGKVLELTSLILGGIFLAIPIATITIQLSIFQ